MQKSPAQIAGELLRTFREEAGLSQTELAQLAHCSQPTISGLERGSAAGTPSTIASIDRALNANGKVVKLWEVTAFGEQSAEKLATLEAQAFKIHDYELRAVPGLLQTPDYARAVIESANPFAAEEAIDEKLRLRIDRQDIFKSPSTPRSWFVLDESILYRPFGGRDAMRAQLASLEVAARRPDTVIQVIRFSATRHPGSAGPLRVMEFTEDLPVWYTEGSSSGRLTDDKDEVRERMSYFDLIRASAMSPDASIRFITKVKESRCG
ncbi:MAG TPA: helix-turn-helix transcriptional regulator [Trebonia sp.]|jgi:transcriptional regulator with XRE-family HTH domain|nr:helix-turn-helix transcriptional regulator [Trebonia sp.]